MRVGGSRIKRQSHAGLPRTVGHSHGGRVQKEAAQVAASPANGSSRMPAAGGRIGDGDDRREEKLGFFLKKIIVLQLNKKLQFCH
ncbi:hypothetical protein GW17_00055121 [Ensete ventricosum]|nr:hypothetical protein GW17_00055121 [Ensete ventricosum]